MTKSRGGEYSAQIFIIRLAATVSLLYNTLGMDFSPLESSKRVNVDLNAKPSEAEMRQVYKDLGVRYPGSGK